MYQSLPSHLRASVALSLVLVATLTLSACASEQVAPTPTLSDLQPATVPVEPTPVPRVSLDQIEEGYRAALEVATDPGLRQQILARLADMEMARSEDRQFTSPEQKRFFGEAISLYRQLLASRQAPTGNPDASVTGNDRLLYQLSKAYALDGRLEESNRVLEKLARDYPKSEFAAEADFRRAEQAFSAGDYAHAEQLYDRVMRVGQTPFYSNSIYMHGWSLFKQREYRRALDSFSLVLDDLMVDGIPLEQLAESRQNLVADTLRIMSLSLSYLDGVDTIADLYDGAQYREFQYLIYRELGDLYRDKKRFRDSADTYLRYTELFPQSDHAPELSARAIDVFDEGNFPSLVLPAKEKYVRDYGINSRYWALRGIIRQEPLLPHLHQYLDELARYYHAEAQKHSEAQKKQKVAGATSSAARQDFLRAADYYRQFIDVFPVDEALPSMTFLMAEACFEGGALVEALMAYEQVAVDFQDPEHGAEAGYSAILTLQRLIDASAASEERAKWQDHKIKNALEFATLYAGDSRAPVVLARAAEELYAQGDAQQALAVATRVTEWQPLPGEKLLRTAWLVRAHSLFDLELHTAAEQAYWQALERIPADDPGRPAIVERIAATLYRQAEQQIAAGDTEGAIEQLLQIREVAPQSEIARKGQYDAANHLMDLREWERAEKVLVDFRERYPMAPVADTVLPKLAVVYQSMNAWEKAADTFSAMAESEKNPDLQRQSLYLAAELYDKAGKEAQAIVHYRSYAHAYAQPFDLATEARYRLVTLYGQTNEPLKRNYWLKTLVDAHQQAKDSFGSNERAHYLAAFASRELANVNYHAFKTIKLDQPIQRNLQRKKKAMEKALASYQQVLAYGVAEFTTEANNRIGMIYTQLSADLMASERPQGLNALELEQYELLLEEQAYPFEEKAIEIHAANAQRSWDGVYDHWVKQSFDVLAKLLPARYGKHEDYAEVSHGIY